MNADIHQHSDLPLPTSLPQFQRLFPNDEAYYELLDMSCKPPLPVEEYESYITKRQ